MNESEPLMKCRKTVISVKTMGGLRRLLTTEEPATTSARGCRDLILLLSHFNTFRCQQRPPDFQRCRKGLHTPTKTGISMKIQNINFRACLE